MTDDRTEYSLDRSLQLARLATATIAEIARFRPRTQEDCCALAARVSADVIGSLDPDLYVLASRAMAQGLFGPAYSAANKEQKLKWETICFEAIVKAREGEHE